MPTIKKRNPCLCGRGALTRGRFAPGHDMRHLKQCLDRLSAGHLSRADDLEKVNPGHAETYDMDCLRANVGQTRKELTRCSRK